MAKQTINLGTAPTGVGGDTPRTAFTKAQANFDELYARDAQLGTAANANVGTVSGNVMAVGAFGLGSRSSDPASSVNILRSGLDSYSSGVTQYPPSTYGTMLTIGYPFSDWTGQLFLSCTPQSKAWIRGGSQLNAPFYEIYTTGNTTRAADGTLKAI